MLENFLAALAPAEKNNGKWQCCQIWCNYTNLVYLESNLWGKFSSGVILFLVESGVFE